MAENPFDFSGAPVYRSPGVREYTSSDRPSAVAGWAILFTHVGAIVVGVGLALIAYNSAEDAAAIHKFELATRLMRDAKFALTLLGGMSLILAVVSVLWVSVDNSGRPNGPTPSSPPPKPPDSRGQKTWKNLRNSANAPLTLTIPAGIVWVW
jgi:hypothetical protein